MNNFNIINSLPVSTSHCLVGSVLGSAIAHKYGEKVNTKIDFTIIKKIVISWVITIPLSMFGAMYFYYGMRGVLV